MGHYMLLGLSGLLLICSVNGGGLYIRGPKEGAYTVPGVEGYFQNSPSTGEHTFVDGQGNGFVHQGNNEGTGGQQTAMSQANFVEYPPQSYAAANERQSANNFQVSGNVQPIEGGKNQYQQGTGGAISPHNGPYNGVAPHQADFYTTNSNQQQNQDNNQNLSAFPPQQEYIRGTNIPQGGYPFQVEGSLKYPPEGAQQQQQQPHIGLGSHNVDEAPVNGMGWNTNQRQYERLLTGPKTPLADVINYAQFRAKQVAHSQ